MEWQELVDAEGVTRVVKSLPPLANSFSRKGTALIARDIEEVEVEDEDGNTLKVKKFLLDDKNVADKFENENEIEINLTAPIHLTMLLLPQLKQQQNSAMAAAAAAAASQPAPSRPRAGRRA